MSAVPCAPELSRLLHGLSKLMETFTTDLVKVVEVARADKSLPESVLSTLNAITINSARIDSLLSTAQLRSAEPRPQPKKEEDKKSDEKKIETESWTMCDRCESPVLHNRCFKRLGKDYCATCFAEIEARQPSKTVRSLVRASQTIALEDAKQTPEQKSGQLHNTLTILNSITEAKRVMQKFAGLHTVLSFNVTEKQVESLSGMFQRYIFNIEKSSNEIRQALNEMEIACDQEILRHHKSPLPPDKSA